MSGIEMAIFFLIIMSIFHSIMLLLITLSMVGLFFHRLRNIDLGKLIPEVEGDFEVDGVPIPRREDLPTSKTREFGW